MIVIACVDAGNYLGRGVAYVTELYRAVCAQMNVPFSFHCFTDRIEADYPAGVVRRALPVGVSGWYNKLYLFADGVFSDYQRVIFFDLDTIIVGPLDEIAAYKGEFAMLRDLTMPSRKASGVMAWRGGVHSSIWSEWVADGKPKMPMGDQEYIEQHMVGERVDCLQDIVKGIYSYKVSCKKALPKDATIVCFHGKPRPHEVKHDWIKSTYGT